MPKDIIKGEVLPNGTIRVETNGPISEANHSRMERFLDELARLNGGTVTITLKEHARQQAEELQKVETALTSLDTTTEAGQFNAALSALCELNPDFYLKPEATLNDLCQAIAQARPEWFVGNEITEEFFWATLKKHGVPERQHFTTLDQTHFVEDQPNREIEGYTLRELLNWLCDKTERNLQLSTEPRKSSLLQSRTVPLPEMLQFYNDPVHGVTVRAFAQIMHWGPTEEFAYAYQQNYADANVTVGLPNGEQSKSLWEFLSKGGPRMVKAHYALWARYYEEQTEGGPRFVSISVPQFCSDIGLKKQKKGGYRPEQKRDAMKLLHALATVEMSLTKTLSGKIRRIRGPIWTRGLIGEEKDHYADLWGNAREGTPDHWEPIGFSYAPGPWFDDPEWRRYHRFMGKIGVGLMQLANDEHQWSILIGGYLATLARIGHFHPIKLKIGTILKNTGLDSPAARRDISRYQQKLWKALDKLKEPGCDVIQDWKLLGTDISEPDMDNPNSLDTYSKAEIYPSGDWRGWIIEIALPFEADQSRLDAAQHRAITAQKREASTKTARRKKHPKQD